MVAPLVVCTLWFLVVFARTYRPLMKFIALRSLRSPEQSDLGRNVQEEAVAYGQAGLRTVGRLTVDEARERGLRFENPSLIMPYVYLPQSCAAFTDPRMSSLDDVWLLNRHGRPQNGSHGSGSNDANGANGANGSWE
jgi:hypothetical protein